MPSPARFLALALAGAAALLPAPTARADGGRPPLMLWAWERPEDLGFLAGRPVGVAFLARTIRLHDEDVTVVPRRQPLRVAPGSYLVAVVRVEPSRRAPPSFGDAQRAAVVAEIVRASALPGVREVQIDLDARASQRASYRRLLAELRRALPAGVGLSMTALASWCTFDRWLDEAPLPVDEVVPMVFAMGPEGPRVLEEIDRTGELPARACRTSVGVAVGGRAPSLRRPYRTWIFNARPWDEATFLSLPEARP